MSATESAAGPDVDVAIRKLLDQRADIQSRLSVLLANQHGLDIPLELSMLRHKIRILDDVVNRHDLLSRVPTLSEAEEARSIQYRCECLELACTENGIDVIEPLKRPVISVPQEFTNWVEKHLELHDSVIGAKRASGEAAASIPRLMPTLKCWDERCTHFIYGLATPQERDKHNLVHHTAASKEPVAGAEFLSPLPPVGPRSLRMLDTTLRQLPPVQTSGGPGPSSALSMASSLASSEDRLEISPNYTLHSGNNKSLRRSTDDSDPESMLPPLKKSRFSQPRLESIGELHLFRETEPCLRCRVNQTKCDNNTPCTQCSDHQPAGREEHWNFIGCFRNPLSAFADIILPGPISSRQTRTPITSPVAQRRNINEYLQISCSFPDSFRDAVKVAADFSDGFWWSANLDPRHSASDVSSGYKSENMTQPPPSLCALASSWYAQDTAYDILELLRLSGKLSTSRQAEEAAYPVLYSSKVLLREVTFFGILHPDPIIRIGSTFNLQSPPETIDLEEHGRLLHECLTRFLQQFESLCSPQSTHQPREVLSGILAVSIFSAARTLLLDMSPGANHGTLSLFPQNPQSPIANSTQAAHSMYRSLVQLFSSRFPQILDNWEGQVGRDDASLLYNTSRLLRRDKWAAEGVGSTAEFLLSLGDGYVEGVGFNGFLRQRRPNNLSRLLSETPLLRAVQEPSRRQELAPPPPSPSSVPSWRAGFQDDVLTIARRTSDIERMSHNSDTERLRRHTMGEAPSFAARQLEPPSWTISASPSRFKPSYQRAPLRRVYCDRCNEYPEGFRGEHELRRHTEAKHSTLVRRWICCEPENSKDATPKPIVPLAGCKACMTQKQYGAYYNAAAHLRRAHFSPHRGSKASGDWPPMAVLKDWMREVRQQQNQTRQERPGGEEMVTDRRPPEQWSSLPRSGAESSSSRASISSPTDDSWRQREGVGQASRPSSRPPDNRSQCPHPDCGRVVKDLAAHMLTHQEERPEKCPIVTCEYHIKGFARKYDKNRHALTHYRGALTCPFCPGAGTPFENVFGRADIFKRHLATEHNVEQSPATPVGGVTNHYDPRGPLAAGTGVAVAATARCSICNNVFAGAQDFYEHLDECVLQVIVPAAAAANQAETRPEPTFGPLPMHGDPRRGV